MKMLIFGNKGQLGHDMTSVARAAGWEVSLPQIDITDRGSVVSAITKEKPDAVINAAAITNVDGCESELSGLAWQVNDAAVAHIADACDHIGAHLVHIGTDYVFDGFTPAPYTEKSEACPLSVYGASKLAGERHVRAIAKGYVVRTSWLYGLKGKNFVRSIIQAANKRTSLKVVDDQKGTPTSTLQLSRQLLILIAAGIPGLYHASCSGSASWYEFALYIKQKTGINVDIEPCKSSEYPMVAPRPKYSVMENSATKSYGMDLMTDWHQAFDEFFSLFEYGC